MNFPLKRGVNFWGWGRGPSKWEYGYAPDRFFVADDIQRCVDLGCDHIRFPITESIMWDTDANRIPAMWDVMKVHESVRPEAMEHNRYGDASVMEADLAQPLAAREQTGYPIFCGEFGVIANTPRDIAARWARDFRTVLEANDIGWTVWCYRGGFAIYDNDGNPTGVHEGLFGN